MIKRGELNTEQQNPNSEDIGNMDVNQIRLYAEIKVLVLIKKMQIIP